MRTIRRRTFLSAWRTLVGPVGPASQLHLPPTSQVLTTQRPHVLPQLEQQRALLRRHHATKAAGGGEGGSSGGPVYGHVSEGADGDTVLYMRDAGSGREYYVIGTAHISKQSAQQVERLMHTIRPDSVMVSPFPQQEEEEEEEEEEADPAAAAAAVYLGTRWSSARHGRAS